jgi:prepilin peptidase CpaA
LPINLIVIPYSHLLSIIPLLALLTWAAIEDVHSRKIRNWLTFSLMLTGLIQSFIPHGSVTPLGSMLGFFTGFALVTPMFMLSAVGGGDLKLLAAVGAWLGPWATFQVFCAEAVIGMIIVLAQATYQGRLRVLTRNSAMLAINLAHVNEVGLDHTASTGQSCRSVNRPLPYAVPVMLAVILVTLGWV